MDSSLISLDAMDAMLAQRSAKTGMTWRLDQSNTHECTSGRQEHFRTYISIRSSLRAITARTLSVLMLRAGPC